MSEQFRTHSRSQSSERSQQVILKVISRAGGGFVYTVPDLIGNAYVDATVPNEIYEKNMKAL